MLKLNRNVGKANLANSTVNIADGEAKLGDTIFTKGGTSWKLTGITINESQSLTLDTNGEETVSKDKNCKVKLDNFYQYDVINVFVNEKNALGTFIANGKIAMDGDVCWMWKGTTLVRKILKRGKFHYEDNQYYLKTENLKEVYGSKREAIKAHPEKAQYLEAAFKRQGRIFEREQI